MPARTARRKAPVRRTQVLYLPMHGQGIQEDARARVFGHIRAHPQPIGVRAMNTVRNNRLISRGLAMAAPRAGQYAPYVQAGSVAAGMLGFGRPRRRPAAKRKKAPVRRKRRN